MQVGQFELRDPLPQLNEPHVIASLTPWIDAGSVGTLTLERLERFMGAEDLGDLSKPGRFFDFTRYRPMVFMEGGQRKLRVPNAHLRYARGPQGTDFLFLHMLEPHNNAEEYIDGITELLEFLQVKRLVRVGSMYDAVPHTRPLLVMGSLNGQPLEGVEGVRGNRRRPYQGPTSIMNLVGDRLQASGVDSMMLMARLPHYVELEADFAGRTKMLRVLSGIYGLPPEYYLSRRDTQQYDRATTEMDRNQQMKLMVERLEAEYDRRHGTAPATAAQEDEPSGESPTPLPPSVERFLGELGGLGSDGSKSEDS